MVNLMDGIIFFTHNINDVLSIRCLQLKLFIIKLLALKWNFNL